MEWQLGESKQCPRECWLTTTFKHEKHVFPVFATRGLNELQRTQKPASTAGAAQVRSAVLLPWTVAEGSLRCFAESVFHSSYHTSHPKISRWVSKPLLRAKAFCTNINILYLPRQPAVKNSFSSKFCFDSLLLFLSYWKLDNLLIQSRVFQALVHSLIFYRLNSKAAKQYILLKMLY